jgi:putative spermidine/putrescine transport system permease protein
MSAMDDGRTLPHWINAYVAVAALLVLLPIIVIVPVSFSASSSLALPTEGLSLRWYQSVFGDASLLRAFYLSMLIAAVSSVISLLLGIPAAYVIARRNLRFLDALLLTPITFPAVVFGGALLMVLAPIGLVRTVPGLIAAHALTTLPFVVRTVVSTIHGIDEALEDAATILGAGRLRVFRYVVLPLAMPGILSALCFAFVISFDEFSVSLFLVGTGVMTLPLEMYQRMQFIINPTIAAASVLLVGVTFVLVFVIERIVGIEKMFGVGERRHGH